MSCRLNSSLGVESTWELNEVNHLFYTLCIIGEQLVLFVKHGDFQFVLIIVYFIGLQSSSTNGGVKKTIYSLGIFLFWFTSEVLKEGHG
jgi:hypothetical protein